MDDFLMFVNADVVITSAWRYLVHGGSMTLQGFRYLLCTHWMDGRRVTGITRKDTMVRKGMIVEPMANERGQQIADYVAEHRITDYVVIDNDDLGISAMRHPFVRVDERIGFTWEDSLKALDLLTREKVAA